MIPVGFRLDPSFSTELPHKTVAWQGVHERVPALSEGLPLEQDPGCGMLTAF